MKFIYARNLRVGDEVRLKSSGEIYKVVEIEVIPAYTEREGEYGEYIVWKSPQGVCLLLDNGETVFHTDIS